MDQTRQGALSEAIAALVEAEQFALILTRPGEADAEIVAFGGVDPAIVGGLQVAHDYLLEELDDLNSLSDVRQLTALLCGQGLDS